MKTVIIAEAGVNRNGQNGRERAVSVIHCDSTLKAITMSLSLITTPMIKGIAAKRANPYYRVWDYSSKVSQPKNLIIVSVIQRYHQ